MKKNIPDTLEDFDQYSIPEIITLYAQPFEENPNSISPKEFEFFYRTLINRRIFTEGIRGKGGSIDKGIEILLGLDSIEAGYEDAIPQTNEFDKVKQIALELSGNGTSVSKKKLEKIFSVEGDLEKRVKYVNHVKKNLDEVLQANEQQLYKKLVKNGDSPCGYVEGLYSKNIENNSSERKETRYARKKATKSKKIKNGKNGPRLGEKFGIRHALALKSRDENLGLHMLDSSMILATYELEQDAIYDIDVKENALLMSVIQQRDKEGNLTKNALSDDELVDFIDSYLKKVRIDENIHTSIIGVKKYFSDEEEISIENDKIVFANSKEAFEEKIKEKYSRALTDYRSRIGRVIGSLDDDVKAVLVKKFYLAIAKNIIDFRGGMLEVDSKDEVKNLEKKILDCPLYINGSIEFKGSEGRAYEATHAIFTSPIPEGVSPLIGLSEKFELQIKDTASLLLDVAGPDNHQKYESTNVKFKQLDDKQKKLARNVENQYRTFIDIIEPHYKTLHKEINSSISNTEEFNDMIQSAARSSSRMYNKAIKK